ncbi:MAG: hypothetical protein H7Y20_02900 [Bryobacteraceae bacterium]|nr:hypothetical protein [Bryobacteraceae bacterium]
MSPESLLSIYGVKFGGVIARAVKQNAEPGIAKGQYHLLGNQKNRKTRNEPRQQNGLIWPIACSLRPPNCRASVIKFLYNPAELAGPVSTEAALSNSILAAEAGRFQ